MVSVFRNAVLCDDIRQEKNNKYILIGVFSGDVVVPQFPATLALSLYAEYFSDTPGQQNATLIYALSGEKKIEAHAKISIRSPGTATLALPPVPIEFPEPGELTISVQLTDSEPFELLRKQVIQGTVAT